MNKTRDNDFVAPTPTIDCDRDTVVKELPPSSLPCFSPRKNLPFERSISGASPSSSAVSPRSPTRRRSRRQSVVDLASAQNEETWTHCETVLRSVDDEGPRAFHVYARVRPLSEQEQGSAEVVGTPSHDTVSVHNGKKGGAPTDFKLDRVFGPEVSQLEVYRIVGLDVVGSCVRGFNTCLFAYGQTASGKSHCLVASALDPGLIPRVCHGLFYAFDRLVAAGGVGLRDVRSLVVEASYYEIYNEKVTDLLNPSSGSLKVREHKTLGVFVEGLSKLPVHSAQEAVAGALHKGLLHRTVQATKMNVCSSRAHAIFELRITQQYVAAAAAAGGAENGMTISSKLSMVDLAGSERAGQQGLKGERLTEGNNINKSLSQLMLCVQFLVKQAKQAHASKESGSLPKLLIPFRDSKLTWLLRESLSGNARTSMLATVSPALANVEDSLSTLRYAASAKNIKTESHLVESPLERRVRELNGEVQRLMTELEKCKNGGYSSSGSSSNSSSSSSSSSSNSSSNSSNSSSNNSDSISGVVVGRNEDAQRAWGALQHRITTNLASLRGELVSEERRTADLRERLSGWAAYRAAHTHDADGLALLQEELQRTKSAPGGLLTRSSSEGDSLSQPPPLTAVYYMVNLNEDEALSGRWQVPVVQELRVGQAPGTPPGQPPVTTGTATTCTAGSAAATEGAGAMVAVTWSALEVGNGGGSDIWPLHCRLVADAWGTVRLLPAVLPSDTTAAAPCFVNGARVRIEPLHLPPPSEEKPPPLGQVLKHGDRVVLGDGASYVAVFLDLRALALDKEHSSRGRRTGLWLGASRQDSYRQATKQFSVLYMPGSSPRGGTAGAVAAGTAAPAAGETLDLDLGLEYSALSDSDNDGSDNDAGGSGGAGAYGPDDDASGDAAATEAALAAAANQTSYAFALREMTFGPEPAATAVSIAAAATALARDGAENGQVSSGAGWAAGPDGLGGIQGTAAAKTTLLDALASARQVVAAANGTARTLRVGVRFAIELKTQGLFDRADDPTATFMPLDAALTYDKFRVCFRCWVALPAHGTTAQHGFAHTVITAEQEQAATELGSGLRPRKPGSIAAKWLAAAAAERERAALQGRTREHLLFEASPDDVRDVRGALAAARQALVAGLSTILGVGAGSNNGNTDSSDGNISNSIDSGDRDRGSSGNVEESATALERLFSMGALSSSGPESALFRRLCALGASASDDDKTGSAASGEDVRMQRPALTAVMSALGIAVHGYLPASASLSVLDGWVSLALTRHDATGAGSSLDEAGFFELLAAHARGLVGSALEHLVPRHGKTLFAAFLDHVPFDPLADTRLGSRADVTASSDYGGAALRKQAMRRQGLFALDAAAADVFTGDFLTYDSFPQIPGSSSRIRSGSDGSGEVARLRAESARLTARLAELTSGHAAAGSEV